jgi:hypothetical protein
MGSIPQDCNRLGHCGLSEPLGGGRMYADVPAVDLNQGIPMIHVLACDLKEANDTADDYARGSF